MVHTEEAALAFDMFDVGVGFSRFLGFFFQVRGFSHDEPAENQSYNYEHHERGQF